MTKRHDILKHWRSRGVIEEDQFRAGRRFEALCEMASGMTTKRLLPAQCSAAPAGPPPAIVARSELDAIRPVLGEIDFSLLCCVLGSGHRIEDAAAATGEHGKAYVAMRIRDALSALTTW